MSKDVFSDSRVLFLDGVPREAVGYELAIIRHFWIGSCVEALNK